jgi:hypothetical protein
MKEIDKIRGDNSIAFVRRQDLEGKKERSPEGNLKRSRGPDNRALARKSPGLRSNGCKRLPVATNLK